MNPDVNSLIREIKQELRQKHFNEPGPPREFDEPEPENSVLNCFRLKKVKQNKTNLLEKRLLKIVGKKDPNYIKIMALLELKRKAWALEKELYG